MPKRSWREFNDPSETSRSDIQKSIPEKPDRQVRIQRIKGGKRGKTVTVVSGLEVDVEEARALLKKLKGICGTGGTVKGDKLELQGDQVETVLTYLHEVGYRPKQSGG